MLLAGDLSQLRGLREQLRLAEIASVEYSGSGVFITFAVPSSAALVSPARFTLGDVAYELVGVENGGGTVLFVRDGKLQMLELYNWTDDWPQTPVLRSISYVCPTRYTGTGAELAPCDTRDLTYVSHQIGGDLGPGAV
jgi:hypothetical protein